MINSTRNGRHRLLLGAGALTLLANPAFGQMSALAPGVYAAVDAERPNAVMQALLACATDPIVVHDDASVYVWSLAPAASAAPFDLVGAGLCSVQNGELDCILDVDAPAPIATLFATGNPVDTAPGDGWRIGTETGPVLLAACDTEALAGVKLAGGSALELISAQPGDAMVLPTGLQIAAAEAETASSGAGLPQGIYADTRTSPLDPGAGPEIALACAERPIVAYPDGLLLGKELDPWAGGAGLSPYNVMVNAQCSFENGLLACDGTRESRFEAPEPLSLELGFSPMEGGHFQTDQGYFARCDVAALNQNAGDGRNVLDEIVRRFDGGPLPTFEGIVFAAGLNAPPPVPTVGDWHGSVTLTLENGAEFGLNIIHASGDQAVGEAYFFLEAQTDACGFDIFGPLCDELNALGVSGGATAQGTLIAGSRLVTAITIPADYGGFGDTLRLVILDRLGTGSYRIAYATPQGMGFERNAELDEHHCGAPPEDVGDCRGVVTTLAALSSGPLPREQVEGIFATDPQRLAAFAKMLPAEIFAQQAAVTAPMEAPPASPWPDARMRAPYATDYDWPGLPPGLYANLLGVDENDPAWLAERCETSPVTAFEDGVLISRSLADEGGYQIDQLFSCTGFFGDIWCDLYDGEGALLADPRFTVSQQDSTHSLCTDGDCFVLHSCAGQSIPPGRRDEAISRPDGGLPLTLD